MKCAKIYKTHYSNTMMSTFTKSKKNAFLLVRHGESIWNQDSKFTGWTNIPLTDVGRDDARNMAESMIYHKIIPNIVFSSVLQRAVETSTIIQKKIEKKFDHLVVIENLFSNGPFLCLWLHTEIVWM